MPAGTTTNATSQRINGASISQAKSPGRREGRSVMAGGSAKFIQRRATPHRPALPAMRAKRVSPCACSLRAFQIGDKLIDCRRTFADVAKGVVAFHLWVASGIAELFGGK